MSLTIIITGALLFLLSLLWYIWTGRLLRGQRASLHGAEAAPLVALAEEAAAAPPPPTTRGARPVSKAPATYHISRQFRLTYTRRIYVHKAFRLEVTIAPEAQALPELTPKERRQLKEAVRDRLEFEALEAEPLLQVELKADEGDFEILEAAQAQPLSRDRLTRFTFLIKALKAEDCLLTVVISYVREIDVPEVVKTVEIVETVEESASGMRRTRVTKSVKSPAGQETVATPLKTLPLTVEVKSFWRFSASGLSLLQKALGPVVVFVLLAIALASGRQIDRTEAIWYGIVGIANAAGIPLIDAVARPFAAPGEEAS